MRILYLLLVSLLSMVQLSAQSKELQRMYRVMEYLRHGSGPDLRSGSADTLACTRETRFLPGAGMSWDSAIQTVIVLEEVNGYPVLTRTEFSYEDSGSGLEWLEIERTIFYGFGQRNDEFQGVDSVIFKAPDFVTGDIVDYGRWYLEYNAAGLVQQLNIFIIYSFNGIPLPPTLAGVRRYYYDQNDLRVAIARREVEGFSPDLIPVDSTLFQNDVSGRVAVETVLNWDAQASQYVLAERETYSYVGNSQDVASVTSDDWNGSAWMPERRELYTYAKPGLRSREDIQLPQAGNNWLTVKEVGFTYDAQDRVTQQLEQNVAPSGAKTPSFRVRNFYDQQEGWIVESISQQFVLNVWNDFSRSLLETCDNLGLAPAAPTALSAQAGGVTSILLSWQDNSAFETGYRIERSIDGVQFTPIHQTGADVTNYTDTGLQDATLYYYRVAAFNQGGNSGYSNVATAQTWTVSTDQPIQGRAFRAWVDGGRQLCLDLDPHEMPEFLSVFDLQGRPVFQTVLLAGMQRFDASSWQTGMYLVQVRYADGATALNRVTRF